MYCLRMIRVNERRRVVLLDAESTNDYYNRAIREGFKVKTEQFFFDVIVGNRDGIFVVVRRRLHFKEAEAFQRHWLMNERDSFCVLWPSKTPMPTEWTLAEDTEYPTTTQRDESVSIERDISSMQQSIEHAIG